MFKFDLNYDELKEYFVKKDRMPLKGNENKIVRVAFDLFRIKDNDPEELWQVQSSEDGEFLVRTFSVPDEDGLTTTSSWSVNSDKKEENITVAYQNMPIVRVATKDYNANDSESVIILKRTLLDNLKNNYTFAFQFVADLPIEKQSALKNMGLKLASEVIDKEDIAKKLFGRSRKECIESKECVVCGGHADEFEDELSEKEYKISGMCQKCQNEFFGNDEDAADDLFEGEELLGGKSEKLIKNDLQDMTEGELEELYKSLEKMDEDVISSLPGNK